MASNKRRHLEIAESTWHRWLAQYGGMKANEAKRLKELEAENARLKKPLRLQRQQTPLRLLVVVAASRSQPTTTTGLDGALKTLGAQPYGAALLIVAGLGIITYGLYSFAMTRYTKM